jgi:hypothetical protein
MLLDILTLQLLLVLLQLMHEKMVTPNNSTACGSVMASSTFHPPRTHFTLAGARNKVRSTVGQIR